MQTKIFFAFAISCTAFSFIVGMEQEVSEIEKVKKEIASLDEETVQLNQKIEKSKKEIKECEAKQKQNVLEKHLLNKQLANLGGVNYPTIEYIYDNIKTIFNLKTRRHLSMQFFNLHDEEVAEKKERELEIESITFNFSRVKYNVKNSAKFLVPNSIYPMIVLHCFFEDRWPRKRTYYIQQADAKTLQISNETIAMPDNIKHISLDYTGQVKIKHRDDISTKFDLIHLDKYQAQKVNLYY